MNTDQAQVIHANDSTISSDYQLLRIIVIDSYCKGKKVELKLDGHVSLNGANGAGKTTLLRLIPIFFGENPNRVIFGKDSFATYYFPTTSSYIVYEYKRSDTKVMAVIHGDGQAESVTYRFIDHPYEDRLFRTDNAFVQSQDFYRHVQTLNIPITKNINRSGYEQIITNTATSMENRQHAARYSFVGSGSKLNHIGRVISGILNRVTEFSDLKRMVVSNAIGEDKQFKLKTNKNDLTKWIKELKSHQAIEDKRPLMAQLEDAEGNRTRLLDEMGTLHSRLHTLVQLLEIQKSEFSQQLALKKENIINIENKYTQRNRELEESRAKVDANYTEFSLQVERLKERFKNYNSEGIDASCELVDSLPKLQSDLASLVQTIAELSGEISNIDDKFDKLKNAESLALQEELNIALGNSNTVKDKSRLDSEAIQIKYEGIVNQHKTASEAVISGLREKKQSANNNVVELKAKLPLIVGDPKIKADLDAAQSQLAVEGNVLKDANQALLGSIELHNQSRRAFEDQERICNDVSDVFEVAEGELSRIMEFSSAGSDTLIGFLRTERADWVDNIGKVISQEVLLRKDLAPKLADGDSLYGIDIDLDKIQDAKLTTEEKIQQELGYARTKVDNAKKACGEEDKKLAALSDALKAALEAKGLCEANKERVSNLSRDISNKIDLLKSRLEYSKNEVSENLRIELEKATNLLEDIRSNIAIEQKKLTDSIAEINAELKAELDLVKKAEADSLNAIADKEKQLKLAHQGKLKDLDASRLEMLKGKGIDQNYLSILEKQKGDLSGKIKNANAISNHVNNYRLWMDDSYSGLTQLEIDASKLKLEVGTIRSEQAKLKTEFEANDRALREETAILSKEESKGQQAIKNTNSQLESISRWPRNTLIEQMPHDSAFTLVDLINEKDRINKEESKFRDIIKNGVYEIRSEMLRVPGTEVEKFCLATELEAGMPIPYREYEWLHVCRIWFNEGYKSKQNSLLADGRSQGMAIKNFCESLESMRTEVATFNRTIRSSLAQAKMFARINSVDIGITTDIERQDYWHAINELKNQYDMWHPTAGTSMPPSSFIDAANDVIKIVNDDRGLVANPTDLINIEIKAKINDIDVSANEEKQLKELSSNGLSYLVLAIVLVGFVNKIRGNNNVAIPYAVDEVRDLDHINSVSLLEFLALNNIMLVGAFPDVDERLAPHFKYKYSVLDDKQIATVEIPDANLLGAVEYV